ncbi:MAG TPA: AraC family transcriptional regulator ligand-binding domain-containing protein [Pseudomonadales bacterium]|nr:AraC family transcriptional regulator ligand-binding domain-containing protein [Pseudomonadales bacterium]
MDGKPRQGDGSGELIALMPNRDLWLVLDAARVSKPQLGEQLTGLRLPTDLLDDHDGHLDPTQAWRLYTSLGVLLDDEHYRLGSRRVPYGTTELIVARAMHARTLREAMAAWCTAANMLLPDMHFAIRRDADELVLRVSYTDGDSDARQVLLELSALAFHSTFRWLTGAPLPPSRFRTARSRPSRAVHLLAVFNCDIEFDGDGVDIAYPQRLESTPIIPRELDGWRRGIYPTFLEDLGRRRDGFSGAELVDYVRHALHNGINDQRAIAASAGMAEATLRRKLNHDGTSFRAISDEVLAVVAREQLDSGATMEQIAARLGYADARSFRRAFQRVTGETTSDHRARRRQNGNPSDER